MLEDLNDLNFEPDPYDYGGGFDLLSILGVGSLRVRLALAVVMFIALCVTYHSEQSHAHTRVASTISTPQPQTVANEVRQHVSWATTVTCVQNGSATTSGSQWHCDMFAANRRGKQVTLQLNSAGGWDPAQLATATCCIREAN